MRKDTDSIRNHLSKEQLSEIYAKTDGKCFYCGKVGKIMAIDHFIPTARGGTDDVTNLVLACGSCNSSKCSSTPEYYHKYRSLRSIGAPVSITVSGMDWLIENKLTTFTWPPYPW
jgi:5-methylcytosine-specific restriction endonuclease McrA